MSAVKYSPPFPWFGGKSKVADIVWRRLGDVSLYVEPFFGSGAVLFMRPTLPKDEIVNDKDCMIANFWRAVKHNPEQVAYYADNPTNEADLTARHIWLVKYGIPELKQRIFADPEYYDAKIAGWWVWGISNWIGSGWCSGNGKWTEKDGKLVDKKIVNEDVGVSLQRPHLDYFQGICKTSIFSENDSNPGVNLQIPFLGHFQGVSKKSIYSDTESSLDSLIKYFQKLSNRLRFVKVCCGDWSRVVTTGALSKSNLVGIFLDPPYDISLRDKGVYNADEANLSYRVRQWCIENGNNPRYRIALCGYEGEHNELEEHGWSKYGWVAGRSYGKSKGVSKNVENRFKERIWFSPYCLKDDNPKRKIS